jgi:hypothetical protein
MVASQARPAYIYDTTLGDWVPMSGVVDTGQAYTFTANQTFNGLVTANNGINAATTLSLQTGGVSRLSIDSGGRVNKPFQPSFYALHTGGGLNDINAALILNSPQVNVGNHYSASTGRFTAPIAGAYMFYFGTIKSDNGKTPDTGTSRFRIRKNGTAFSTELRLSENGGYGESSSLVASTFLSANDYVDVFITDAGGWYGGTYAHFGGYLIG